MLTMRFRVTAEERADLLARARQAGMSYSDYIRVRTLGSKPQTKKASPLREAIIKLMAALGKSGSNLNQMARVLNRKAHTMDDMTGTLKLVEYAVHDHRTILNQLHTILEDNGHTG